MGLVHFIERDGREFASSLRRQEYTTREGMALPELLNLSAPQFGLPSLQNCWE